MIYKIALLVIISSYYFILTTAFAETKRQAEVAERGSLVMPFALAKTQHQFIPTASGGIQRVVVIDSQDQQQIQLIQQHLKQLADKFSQGDYSSPETIHGADMPGLAILKAANPGSMQISYQAETNGASLNFMSAEPVLINAVHDWFKAQVHDHGHDAMAMPHDHQHQ